MVMQSNEHQTAGVLSYVSNSWGTSPPVNEDLVVTKTRYKFVVSPNPCHNGVSGNNRTLPHAYSFSRSVLVSPYGFRSYNERNYSSRLSTHHAGVFDGWWQYDVPWPDAEFDFSQTDAKAIAKLYEAIRNSEVNLSSTIGEGKESLVMLAPLAKSIKRTYDQLRKLRKNPVRAPQALKRLTRASLGRIPRASQALIQDLHLNPLQTVGGLYLGWSVGLAPLLNDLENIRNHVLSGVENKLVIKAKSRSGLGSDKNYQKLNVQNASSRKFSFNGRREQRVEYGVTFRIADTHDFENWRAGLAFRVTTAWELTTLSFVVDYFVKMGEFLSSVEAALLNNGMAFLHGYRTQGTLYEMDAEMTYESGDPELSAVQSSNLTEHIRASKFVTSKNRSVLSSFPVPSTIRRTIPAMSGPLLNCAALLSQLISRR